MTVSTPLFADHSRLWASNRFVYPVISRRSRGLSIGVNLNPDGVCNFGCVYCNVDRNLDLAGRKVDLSALERELAGLLDAATSGALFEHPPFSTTPPSLRRLNDVALSGDGEPTSSPHFPPVCKRIGAMLAERGLEDVKTVVITNATLLDRPRVIEALAYLDTVRSELWVKLDAGTQAWFDAVARSRFSLDRIQANILATGRARPIVIQTMVLKLRGAPPPEEEIAARIDRLRALIEGGCRIARVQVYTVARRVAEQYATAVEESVLEGVAQRIRALGIEAETFPAPI